MKISMGKDISVIKEFILKCRRDEGIPMFKTKFAGKTFENKVLAVCWGGRDGLDSMWIDVSPETFKFLEEGREDWIRFMEKYGTPEEIKEAYRYGIYIPPKVWIPPTKLPKIK